MTFSKRSCCPAGTVNTVFGQLIEQCVSLSPPPNRNPHRKMNSWSALTVNVAEEEGHPEPEISKGHNMAKAYVCVAFVSASTRPSQVSSRRSSQTLAWTRAQSSSKERTVKRMIDMLLLGRTGCVVLVRGYIVRRRTILLQDLQHVNHHRRHSIVLDKQPQNDLVVRVGGG